MLAQIIPAIRRSLNSADIASTLFVIQLRNYADDSCRQSEEWVSRKLDAFAFVEDDIPAAIPIQQRLFALLSPTRSTNPEVLAETVRLEVCTLR